MLVPDTAWLCGTLKYMKYLQFTCWFVYSQVSSPSISRHQMCINMSNILVSGIMQVPGFLYCGSSVRSNFLLAIELVKERVGFQVTMSSTSLFHLICSTSDHEDKFYRSRIIFICVYLLLEYNFCSCGMITNSVSSAASVVKQNLKIFLPPHLVIFFQSIALLFHVTNKLIKAASCLITWNLVSISYVFASQIGISGRQVNMNNTLILYLFSVTSPNCSALNFSALVCIFTFIDFFVLCISMIQLSWRLATWHPRRSSWLGWKLG